MPTKDKATLKSYFETGDKPTQSQFADLIDSMSLTTDISNGRTTFPYLKHSSVTEEDIGKIMMVNIDFLVEDPTSPDQVEVRAKVCNTVPGAPGIKGRYSLKFPKNPLTEPKRKKINLSFTDKMSDGNSLYLHDPGEANTFLVNYTNGSDAGHLIGVGDNISLKVQIDNLVSALESDQWGACTVGYGWADQLNDRGMKFIGTGLNDVSYLRTATPPGRTGMVIELMANEYQKITGDSITGTYGFNISGETVTGGTSGTTAKSMGNAGTSLFIYDASGAFTPGETITGSTSGATITNIASPDTFSFDVVKVSYKWAYGMGGSILHTTLHTGDSIGSLSFSSHSGTLTFASDSGHTIGDKWYQLHEFGGMIFNITDATGAFTNNEQITTVGGAQGIYKTSAVAGVGQICITDSNNVTPVFTKGDIITGTSSGSEAELGDWDDDTDYGDVYVGIELFMGSSLKPNASFYTDCEVDITGSAMSSTVTQEHTSQLAYTNATQAKSNAGSNQALIWGYSWDSNNSYTNILYYSDLFINNDFGSFGSSAEFSTMKFYPDTSTWIDAIDWALDASSGGVTQAGFSRIFNKIGTPSIEEFTIFFTVETRTVPTGNSSNITISYNKINENTFWDLFTLNQTVAPLAITFEHVPGMILGILASIEGSNAIIDGGYILPVKLSDDAVLVLPFTEQLIGSSGVTFLPYLFAWRNGTVIDIFGLMQTQGIENLENMGMSLFLEATLLGGLFSTLNLGLPGQNIYVKRSSFLFFGD
ncbi:MAG: hypothetical protein JWN78_391 [Bacteroidota bacterium]|nr:hypothetical protein [Bacteroidota bacterium]